MHTRPSSPVLEPWGHHKTHFPIVPIEQVPEPEAAGGAIANRPLVLVVDDDAAVTDTLVDILNRSGYVAIAAYDGQDALETALLVPPDLVIADTTLPDGSGLEVAAELKSKLPGCKIVLLGAEQGTPDAMAAARLAELAFAVVEKPVQPAVLLAKVSASLKR
jgi:two-component system alkaline phosphatase synthesis response regulator PhoP